MRHSFSRLLPKFALGSVLALGLATGIVASNAQPAQAEVIVSVGVGGYAPAPAYRWHRWHDGDGWHRRWAPVAWAPPIGVRPERVSFVAPDRDRWAYTRPERDRWAYTRPDRDRWAYDRPDHDGWASSRPEYRR